MKNRRTHLTKHILLAGCTSLLLILPATAAETGTNEPIRIPVTRDQIERLNIKVSQVTQGKVLGKINAPAEIKVNAEHMSYVVPKVPGHVLKISVQEGALVSKGQDLATVDSPSLAQAKAEYVYLTQQSQQTKPDMNEHRFRMENAERTLKSYGVDPAGVLASSDAEKPSPSLYSLSAPQDGVILEQNLVRGQAVNSQKEAFIIADVSVLWVDIPLSQAAVAEVKKGQTVNVVFSDTMQPQGKIDFISPVTDPETRTVLARAILENPEGAFRPGTFVEAEILVPSKEDAIVVPLESVQYINDKPCVFVWGNSDFELRQVVLGVSDGKKVEVIDGVRVDELVASENAFHLKAEAVKSAETAFGGHGHPH